MKGSRQKSISVDIGVTVQMDTGAEKIKTEANSVESQALSRLQLTGLLSPEKESASDAFLGGLADGAYRMPARAIKQLAGDAEALKAAEPAPEQQSRKVGQIIGSLVPFAVLGMATKGASNKLFGAELTPTLWRSVGEQAATGFLLGSALTPSELKPGETLLGSRLHHGINSAVTFGVMGGSAHYLDGALPQFGKSTLATMGRRFSIAAGSGAAGGVIDAELQSGFKASASDVLSSALGYAAFGVAMEGGTMAARSLAKNINNSASRPTEQFLQLAENRARAEHLAKLEALAIVSAEIESGSLRSSKAEGSVTDSGGKTPLKPDINTVGKAIEGVIPGHTKDPADTLVHKNLVRQLLLEEAKKPVALEPQIQRLIADLEAAQLKQKLEAKPAGENIWEPDKRVSLLPKQELPYVREQLLQELKSFQGGGENNSFKLYRQLMNMNWMSDAQKIRLTDVICQVREFYAKQNTPENPQAFKAQRSWALSQASVAEVINNAIIETKAGSRPDPKVLEEKILLQLFTQFRIHENVAAGEMSPSRMHADRQSAARTILNDVGYPKEQILRVTDALRNETLAAQPLDLVKFDADKLKAFEPTHRQSLQKMDPALGAERPIQEQWKIPSGAESEFEGARLSRWSNEKGAGQLIRKTDGPSIVYDTTNGNQFVYDSAGRIQRAGSVHELSNIDVRKFQYDNAGTLERIESSELGKLYRSSKGDWFKDLGPDKDGKPRIEYFWKGKIVADDNGAVRLINADASQVRVYEMNGTEIWYPKEGRPEFKSASHPYEYSILKDRVDTAFTDSTRALRMDNLLLSFEKEASARGVGDGQRALFYKHLNRLLSLKEGMELPLSARMDLAEQATNHAAFPTTIDQGRNSTCNVTTIENRIYTRSPQEIARMLADLAETGSYTTHSGARVDMKNSVTGLRPDAEAREAIKLQAEGKADIKVDGYRDWASQLAQTVMAKIKHLKTTELIAKDTLVENSSIIFDKSSSLLGKVRESDVEPVFDAGGKKVKSLTTEAQQVFRKVDGALQPIQNEQMVFNRNGELLGNLKSDAQVLKLYDYFGNQFKELVPGANYFDEKGKLVMYETVPGDITYEKLPTDKPGVAFKPTDDTERLTVTHLGKRVYLKEMVDGKPALIESPLLSTPFYRDIANEVTGTEKAAFSIALGQEHKTFHSTIRVTSLPEFEAELQKMKEAGNFPGILRVHTRNWPFNHQRGGWHVVNIQGYDPLAKTMEFTNQWGSKNDYVGDRAVPAEKMFKAMAEPKEPPKPKADTPPQPVPGPPQE